MKKILVSFLLLLGAASLSAQPAGQSQDDKKAMELRQQIGLDYSMPDYSVKKIDASVIGPRLAKILTKLLDDYKQLVYNQFLAMIRSQNADDPNLQYVHVEKLKLLKISKSGNTITILFNTFTKDKNRGKLDYDLDLSFVDGLSENNTANDLFCYIGKYINDDE